MLMDHQPEAHTGKPAVTSLLNRASEGDRRATDELFPIVYDELRQIAARFMQGEKQSHTLQATALVHEAYMRLLGPEELTWENRAHFFGAAALAIRRILTDHARQRGRIKRGGGASRVDLDDSLAVEVDPSLDFVELDAALTRLAGIDGQKATIVHLRFFAGLTVEQTALAMGISESTVARGWQFARVWLARELAERDTQ